LENLILSQPSLYLEKGKIKMKKIYPNLYYKKVEEITIETLLKNKIKLLILDVDNTLIDYYKNLSEEVKQLPNDKGGIYLYVIENCVIPNSGSYIMYVGRARCTQNENLRNRAKSHFKQYVRHEENERLERLFDKWKPYIYLLYLPIDGNDEIDLVEDELIIALTPPCNKEYPSPKIRKKLSAFNYS